MKLSEALLVLEYSQSHHDYSFFIRKSEGHTVLILVYVDDLLSTRSSATLIQEAKAMLNHYFKISQRLTSVVFDIIAADKLHTTDELLEDSSGYQKLVGKLLYRSMIGPDMSYAVQNLCQFMHMHKKSHMEATLRVVINLRNAPG